VSDFGGKAGPVFSLNPRELVVAALRDIDDSDLTVCQIVKDAARAGFSWSDAPPPDFPYVRARAVYASLVDLLAWRNGDDPPTWTRGIGPAPAPVFLVRSAKRCPFFLRLTLMTPACMAERNVFALPDYMDLQPWLKGPKRAAAA
jgi:hypothetical protein